MERPNLIDYQQSFSFDENSIYDVYSQIADKLLRIRHIELGVIQALSYCLYELADNVLNHSGKGRGQICLEYIERKSYLGIIVIDNGIGIWESLKSSPKYKDISEEEALKISIDDKITDGIGRGFGLYSTSLLIKNAGRFMEIMTGNYTLRYTKSGKVVHPSPFYQGTKVQLNIITDITTPANKILADRADGEEEFNDAFLKTTPFNNLW